jgi:hypothetical protein
MDAGRRVALNAGLPRAAMTRLTPLAQLRAPLGGQEIELQQIDFDAGGMSLLRTRIREKSRFTVFDIDPITAEPGARPCSTGRSQQPRGPLTTERRHGQGHAGSTWPSRCTAARCRATTARAGRRAGTAPALAGRRARAARLVHRLNLAAGDQGLGCCRGARGCTLRVPRERADDAARWSGSPWTWPACPARGPPTARAAALAHAVRPPRRPADATTKPPSCTRCDAELAAGHAAAAICGRHQQLDGGALQGYSLMLDGLTPTDALRVLEQPAWAAPPPGAAASSCRTSRPPPSAPRSG